MREAIESQEYQQTGLSALDHKQLFPMRSILAFERLSAAGLVKLRGPVVEFDQVTEDGDC